MRIYMKVGRLGRRQRGADEYEFDYLLFPHPSISIHVHIICNIFPCWSYVLVARLELTPLGLPPNLVLITTKHRFCRF